MPTTKSSATASSPASSSDQLDGKPLGEGCPKKPWHSKKWTYAMWTTTILAVLFVVYLFYADPVKDPVLYAILALFGSVFMLAQGGIAALDRYRMGLVQVAEVVRGRDVVDEQEGALALPDANVEEIVGDNPPALRR